MSKSPASEFLAQSAVPVYSYKIAQVYPHDRTSYTQGMVVENGSVYEGTGLYGRSKLRHWELRSGRILNEIDLEPHYFGEGITVLDGTIYQLTYLANTAFTYDQGTLQRKDRFHYITQGWGLTNDGEQLLMSNGSSAIVVVHPNRSKSLAGFLCQITSDRLAFSTSYNTPTTSCMRMSERQTSLPSLLRRPGRSADGLI